MAKTTIPNILLEDLLIGMNPRLEDPKAESELSSLRELLAPACEQVITAYAAVAKKKVTERAFRCFLKNLLTAT